MQHDDEHAPHALDYPPPQNRPSLWRLYFLAGPAPAIGGRIGAAVGAVGIPFAFLVVAVVGGDPGGPCFWPLAVIIFGAAGWIIGTLVGLVVQVVRSLRNRSC
jgi:hypothetical protein